MPSKFLVKRSNVAGKEPQPADLDVGELALNFKDKKIFTKEPGGTIIEMVSAAPAAAATTTPANVIVSDPASGTSQSITAADAADTPLTLTGATGQTANLFQIDTDKVVVKADGKVGIGTTTPDGPLMVATTAQDDSVVVSRNTGGSQSLRIWGDAGGMQVKGLSPPNSAKPLYFDVATNDGSAPTRGSLQMIWRVSGSEAMRIDSNRNVIIKDLAGTGNRMVVTNPSGVLSAQAIPTAPTSMAWSAITGKPSLLKIGTTATTAAAGNHNHNTVYGRLKAANTFTGLNTFSGAANANIRLSNGAMHDALILGTDAQGDLVKRNNIPWANIASKPTLPTRSALATNRVVFATSSSNINTGRLYTTSAASRLGIGVSPSKPLHVKGEIVATGDITSFYSDMRLKAGVKPLSNALDRISQLSAFTYYPNEAARKAGAVESDDDKRRVGVSAQDVQKVLPEAVAPAPFDLAEDGSSKSGEDYLTVNYEKLVPLLIAAIKDLQAEVEALKNGD